jgi:hypothetical protein
MKGDWSMSPRFDGVAGKREASLCYKPKLLSFDQIQMPIGIVFALPFRVYLCAGHGLGHAEKRWHNDRPTRE